MELRSYDGCIIRCGMSERVGGWEWVSDSTSSEDRGIILTRTYYIIEHM